ncbi:MULTISPECIES: endo alpha-1,4 polygalactosaminidase [unclassified Streptomyces]|uniref:endo alpha-1,4 polygalactosaminidase n=1 Tax=unclassified Streptomyces TaxID=2593676 RepID=UPI002250741E|nr:MULTISPECIES: endo alpha-1,4 polygalactosaminidase [unclassified Streptomyces]MCX4529419.1 endo alpha-1,4 polygalactosaminidase [Streptomyces sp. NBC_01551]MCX4540041.1 endo alpha-1,4 polygalactosaminidase [Streptomyces sp. NBC_01565]
MNRTLPARAGLLAALTALVLTGCSASEGDDDTPAPSGRPTSSPSTPTTAPPSSPSSSPSPSTAPSGSPSPPASPSGGASPAPGDQARARWRPKPGLAWQWQLNGRSDPTVDVPVYDIDGFENSAADVARLHRDGRKVICYVNVGAWEDFRPDRDAFPGALLGEPNGWRGERWLDIRRLDLLRPIMERRFDMCREKGFDAVEPDLMEGYGNHTGFPLTAAHQLAYNRMIAEIAHARGLSVGLKNDLPQIPQLVGDFDFAVNEECAQFGECDALTPFVKAGKAVFHVEYEGTPAAFCPESRELNLSSMLKKPELDTWRKACP